MLLGESDAISVSATESKKVDVRVVAAPNAGLSARVDTGGVSARSLPALDRYSHLDSAATGSNGG